MKILTVSDVESKRYYDYYKEGMLSGIDLIISCGDLKTDYLEFLVTMADCPLLYVHGNHDDRNKREPEGCICIDDTVFEYNGVRFFGLGGSYQYRNGKYMYTERQMKQRILKQKLSLIKNKGFDVLVTHAPARHLNDLNTVAHRGFECFNDLIRKYEPKLFVHGHVHLNYGTKIPRKTKCGNTTVINAYEYYVTEY